MTDMIERVAVAINQAMLLHDDYDPDLLARAAILAMRDCTPAMLDAGSAAHPAGGRLARHRQWRAMVDAALVDDHAV